jgi:hypothetical protein
MRNYLVIGLIIFFSVLLIYQITNSVNILEGLEGDGSSTDATTTKTNAGSGCDCNQIYTNTGNITTLQNDVKKHSGDIEDLKTSVNALVGGSQKK